MIPVVRVPLIVGVLSRVMLSIDDCPRSLDASRSGAVVGAAGATVSIVTEIVDDAGPVRPLDGSRVAALTLNVPSAVNVPRTE